MRILIALPPVPAASGNQITADRYGHGLERRGHTVQMVSASPGQAGDLRRAVAGFRPDLVHLLHAYRTGAPWLEIESLLPFVVTLTGTDIHHDLDTPDLGPIVRGVLEKAGGIITQNPLTVTEVKRHFPELADRVGFLPPGIILGVAPYPLRRQHAIPPGPLLLHPAGIRPVKGNLELLELFDPLAAAGHSFTVAFCGPPLDETYSRRLFRSLDTRPWARYLGIIPPPAIPAALREADVVLNNSATEGMSNALLEAAALGRPILARGNPGNAAIVEHGRNGLLYGDGSAFLRHAAALLDPAFRASLSRPEPERYHPDREAAALEALYRSVLAT